MIVKQIAVFAGTNTEFLSCVMLYHMNNHQTNPSILNFLDKCASVIGGYWSYHFHLPFFGSQECKSCLVLRGKLAQAEALLEEKSSVSSFAPLNEAMAEDLQKLRERVREVSDQESALKEKLRAVDADYLALTNVSKSLPKGWPQNLLVCDCTLTYG